ncbi:aromatic amino acid:proton symporter, AAT family [Pseudomonas pohangensis]|uniref:Aromatic amino acid:proton symporter, AAT family n=1 Tax=Pseudomonas pohangensis TaxID=364197 RepID=A0A1H2GEQ2_9PSED|nr:amino acid permease [Pseudomonas pohangensis]SDU17999.1 aromatic amino acid:proton symporter, AAT family [Pseudomonas pohangensis]
MQEPLLHEGALKRSLQNRHIQLIALGGAIGTGLFLGSAGVLKSAGPSMILGYAIAGCIAFLIMRQLGEMIVEEPVAGSFSHFAHNYWGRFAGFLSGWNYWALYLLVGMAELTAVGKYVQFWWPEVPSWVTAASFFVLINLINLTSARWFGETEFWFALIKVITILGMIILGMLLLATGSGGPQAGVSNLWSHGGFFPNGLQGLIMVLAIIMFSFGGLELVGITAAEAENPRKVIPQAINQVVFRILIFYVGALSVLLMLYPWNLLLESINSAGDPYSGSPFVLVFSLLGRDVAANLLNFVVLTAALSVYNSGVYCNSRMLYGLAEQGDAPRVFTTVNRRGVPVLAIGVSALMTLLCVLINYLAPGQALEVLMSLAVAALLINWTMISLTHLKFRVAMRARAIEPGFKAFWYPLGNYLCLLFVAGIALIMLNMPGIRVSILLLPVWIGLIWLCFRLKQRSA